MTKLELRTLIKEVVKEVLLEESGVLSKIIKEVVTATSSNTILSESRQPQVPQITLKNVPRENKLKISQDQRKRMLDAIGFDKGLDPFAGTTPLSDSSMLTEGAISITGRDPNDSGVSENLINNIMGGKKFKL